MSETRRWSVNLQTGGCLSVFLDGGDLKTLAGYDRDFVSQLIDQLLAYELARELGRDEGDSSSESPSFGGGQLECSGAGSSCLSSSASVAEGPAAAAGSGEVGGIG